MSTLSAHVLEEIRELPAKYPQPRSAVMPALDLAQEELGHLTPAAMTEVAEALQLDAGYVEGVATFYSLFHLEPVGKHHFYVCTNLSCMLRGANEIVDHLKEKIDGLISERRSPGAKPASAPHPDPLPPGGEGGAKPKRKKNVG
jgi:NADH-quinone oxidoreductase subunit E